MESPRDQRSLASSATAALDRGPMPEQIARSIGARMSSISVNRAFDQFALRGLLPGIDSEEGGTALRRERPPTAIQFLRISESELPNACLSGEIPRPVTYELRFGRRAVGIKAAHGPHLSRGVVTGGLPCPHGPARGPLTYRLKGAYHRWPESPAAHG